MRLKPEDEALVNTAIGAIKARFIYGKHSIGAAVRMRSGPVFLGINLNTYAGHLAVCAEGVAIGAALTRRGNDSIDTIVAVRHPPPEARNQEVTVVTPCGACRERIFDYGPNARVIVPGHLGKPTLVMIGELLPNKYMRPL